MKKPQNKAWKSVTATGYYIRREWDAAGKTDTIETIRTLHLKSPIFWNITPFSLLKVNRRFEGMCYLSFQFRSISQARNQREAGSYLLIILSWRLTRNVRPKCRLISSGTHGVTSQNHRSENFESYIVRLRCYLNSFLRRVFCSPRNFWLRMSDKTLVASNQEFHSFDLKFCKLSDQIS